MSQMRLKKAVLGITVPESLRFEFTELDEAPLLISTDADAAFVIPVIKRLVQTTDYRAYILACFSDPGIDDLRDSTGKKIVGIGESAYKLAISEFDSFGIISVSSDAVNRHTLYLQRLGLLDKLVADISLCEGNNEINDDRVTFTRLSNITEELISRGVGSVILGCAGFAQYRKSLGERYNIPVVEPVSSAVRLILADNK